MKHKVFKDTRAHSSGPFVFCVVLNEKHQQMIVLRSDGQIMVTYRQPQDVYL